MGLYLVWQTQDVVLAAENGGKAELGHKDENKTSLPLSQKPIKRGNFYCGI
ncbi:MAG: hypothetical protein ACM3KM_02565 [Acidobacteriaceae bacterium]